MTTDRPASEKQLKWLRDLLVERNTDAWPPDWRIAADTLRTQFRLCHEAGYGPDMLNNFMSLNRRKPVTHNDFQRLLPKLQEAPRAEENRVKIPGTNIMAVKPVAPLEDGVYKVGDTIYKVKHSQNDRQWAYRLTIVNEPTKGGHVVATFKYAGRPQSKGIKAEHLLTYEDAKAFGALYGICCCCGRLLTNELSIALGIGPVCGDRQFGGEFKFMIDKAKLRVKDANRHALNADPFGIRVPGYEGK